MDWLKIKSGRGILIYSAWQGLIYMKENDVERSRIITVSFFLKEKRKKALYN